MVSGSVNVLLGMVCCGMQSIIRKIILSYRPLRNVREKLARATEYPLTPIIVLRLK